MNYRQPENFKFSPEGHYSLGWHWGLVSWGWEQKEIFQHRKPLEFFLTVCDSLMSEELYEWVVEDEAGIVVAAIIAAVEHDQHVGECLSVRWALTKEPSLLTKGYRKLFEQAKYLGIPFICYTKEIAPYTYTVRYKKVKLDAQD